VLTQDIRDEIREINRTVSKSIDSDGLLAAYSSAWRTGRSNTEERIRAFGECQLPAQGTASISRRLLSLSVT